MRVNDIVKQNIDKYKDIIPYAVFGVLTTVVNLGSYWILTRCFGCGVMVGTIVAWVAGVLFAYVTNRKWVFHSDKVGVGPVFKEMIFFSCRLFTGFVDWIIMFVFAEQMRMTDVYVKFLANVIVILMNYIFSKKIIFRKGK